MSKEFYMGMGQVEHWPALSHRSPTELTYADVVLVPGIETEVESRESVDLSVPFGPYTLEAPIISAPMDTVTGEEMMREMHRLGGIGSLPRGDLQTRLDICERLSTDNIRGMYAVGHKTGLEEAQSLKNRGAQVILVDVAHGGMTAVLETAANIKDKLGLTVVAGNIVTYEQAMRYREYGIDIARVGVGPGAVCKTREVAGTGFPQLSAVFETSSSGIYVIADGGIKYSGDIAKALAAGAKAVMIGTMFAGTTESPGDVIEDEHGRQFKMVRGQASRQYMTDHGVQTTRRRAEEGVAAQVPYRGNLEGLFHDLTGGIASAFSYAGANTVDEFEKKARFALVSPAADREGHPHVNM